MGLLDDLKKSFELFGDARVITIASSIHDYDASRMSFIKPLDISDVFLTEGNEWESMQAYANSKVMNILFTYALARRLGDNGVTTNCLCPGFIPTTGIFKDTSIFMKPFFKILWLSFGSATTEKSALHIYDMSTSKEFAGVTGKYFSNGEQKLSQRDTYDQELQEKVWSLTEAYVKLNE